MLRVGPSGWPRLGLALRLGVGFLMLAGACLALAAARAKGLNFLLSTLCIVWMADIAAYFGGRAWGRRKLAPSISPGKSWAGVYSGVGGVFLLGALWLALEPGPAGGDSGSLFDVLRHASLGGMSWLLGIVGLALLCALSVMGDLLESLVKRAAGAKDSSGLLPGHGGVLDRLDALLPVLPAALALASL
jgi:phosphatidate cytidylyltransferase